MKRLFILCVSAFLSFCADLPARAQTNQNPFAGAPKQYNVSVVTSSKTGSMLTMRMYVDGNKRRTEQETNSGPLVLILRGDINLMYTIIVSRKAYRISALDPSLLASLDAYEFPRGMIVSHEKLATETIKGQLCDKYRFSASRGEKKSGAGSDSKTSGYIWINQSTHLPVMSKTEGATSEWINLDIGPQDSSLFEPPAEYQQLQ
jgi:hypothetical protein